ncbi:hypothetical protein [Arenimonas donghaensis]|uniref:Uncharacterized protein n=1 Tax=Arenimonas donghaensis DSM 18148 = HO3-R19 TaxID=1121014 RepID=A0A087MKY9_9GAMM|nr:hypothetical protein [Arenimonas donghaensis]KFL37542.1 hypothetical protein N788_09145 [Arenimonas donghaensis DSM 18148 = HO3-R19]
MPRLHAIAARAESDFPVLTRLLWQALVLGVLAVALLPPARGDSALLGALPFWLLAAPAAALFMLHRRFLAAAWRAHLVRATPRRRQRFSGRQARRASRARPGAFARAA